MTKIMGIDYGRSKIGLAVSEGVLSEPLKVVRVTSFEDAVNKIQTEIEMEKPDKVIVGVSEGVMGEESKKFALAISHWPLVIVETFDETLSTQDAQVLSREAGIGQKKRREMEDAYAASVILQSYLDSKKL